MSDIRRNDLAESQLGLGGSPVLARLEERSIAEVSPGDLIVFEALRHVYGVKSIDHLCHVRNPGTGGYDLAECQGCKAGDPTEERLHLVRLNCGDTGLNIVMRRLDGFVTVLVLPA
ncbi:hypothetical protein AB0H73_06305 [Streptomyces olivoreticuli]